MKVKHRYDSKDLYTCKKDDCNRSFHNIDVCITHLTNKHADSSNNSKTPDLNLSNAMSVNPAPISSKVINFTENTTTEHITSTDNNISAVEHQRALQNSALKYASHF